MKPSHGFVTGLLALLLAGVAGSPANAMRTAADTAWLEGEPTDKAANTFVAVDFSGSRTNPTRFCELAESRGFLAIGYTAKSCLHDHWKNQFPHLSWAEYAEYSRTGYKDGLAFAFPLDVNKWETFVVATNGGTNLDLATATPDPALVMENGMLKQRLGTAEAQIADLQAKLASTPVRVTTSPTPNLGREAQLEIQLVNAGVKIGELEEEVANLTAQQVNPQAAIDQAVAVALARQAEVTALEVARVQENTAATITATRNQAEADIAAATRRFAEAEAKFTAAMEKASRDVANANSLVTARNIIIADQARALGLQAQTLDAQSTTLSNQATTIRTLDNWGAHTVIAFNSWMATAIDFASAHSLLIVLALIVLLAGMLAYRFTDPAIAFLGRFRPTSANATS